MKPVLIVTVGSTAAELPLRLRAEAEAIAAPARVPHRVLCFDTLSYEALVARLESEGWTRSAIEEAIPRAHYVRLPWPFGPGFDFEASSNESWREIVFDQVQREAALQADIPGAAGIPALGRARAAYGRNEIKNAARHHAADLTHVGHGEGTLESGILTFVVTTARGGTGTGATPLVGAVLADAVPAAELHLLLAFPCVFGGDDRARANACGMARELAHAHRAGGTLAAGQGERLPSPFRTVTPLFLTNGQVSIDGGDLLALVTNVITVHLRREMQEHVAARLVDLQDVRPFGLGGRPNHVRQMNAIVVRAKQPGFDRCAALELVREASEERQLAFDGHVAGTRTLDRAESTRVTETVERIVADHGLELAGMLRRVAGDVAELRAHLETRGAQLARLGWQEVQKLSTSFPAELQTRVERIERDQLARARDAEKALPGAVVEALDAAFLGVPHLELAACDTLAGVLERLAEDADAHAVRGRKVREESNRRAQDAQHATLVTRGVFVLGRKEVVRDNATTALQHCKHAAEGRLAQHQGERVAALTRALRERITAHRDALIGDARDRLQTSVQTVSSRAVTQRQELARRSARFQIALEANRSTPAEARRLARELWRNGLSLPSVDQFVWSPTCLDAALADVIPLLPSHSAPSLATIVERKPEELGRIVATLRNLQAPFAEIDPVLADPAGTESERRDRIAIYAVPGGEKSILGQELIRAGLVKSADVLDSGDEDELRAFFLRDGISWTVLKAIRDYERAYQRHAADRSSISPHSHAEGRAAAALVTGPAKSDEPKTEIASSAGPSSSASSVQPGTIRLVRQRTGGTP